MIAGVRPGARIRDPSRGRKRRRGAAWTLPVPLSSFVGRRRELGALGALIDRGQRLVTITGPGGMGKTRLALEAARHFARDGAEVAFCDLSEVSAEDELVSAVATSLGFAGGAVATKALSAHVGRALARAGRGIVVLDNFEQLVAHASHVGRWLAQAPDVVFVVTSRERLRIDGEYALELQPLGHVGDGTFGHPSECDAVRLLVERGRAASSSFAPGDDELAIAAAIVRALDGIPLAIELCASRLGVLGLRELSDYVADGTLGLGAVEAHGRPPRHAALRATIEWSWRMLPEDLRDALARCSVFQGGFRLDAVRSVLELPDGARGTTAALERMQALHDRSLVRALAAGPSGNRRFTLYASVRELAAERLAERGAVERVRALHAAHYCSLGRALADAADGEAGLAARDELSLESKNLLAVAHHGAPPEALSALLSLEPIFAERGPLDPYADALDRALSVAAEGRDRALATLARARIDITRGRFDEAIETFTRARDEGRRIGDERIAALASSKLGVLGAFLDREGAAAAFDEAESIARTIDDPRLAGICLSDRASALSRDGAEREAQEHRRQAVHAFARAGDARRRAVALGYLGSSCLSTGQTLDAERYTAQAAAELRALGDRRTEGQVLGFLARARHDRGRLLDAQATLGAALACLVEVGERWFEGVFEGWLGDVELEDRQAERAAARYERAVLSLDLALERPYAALFRAALSTARRSLDPCAPIDPVELAGLPPMIAAAARVHEAHAALLGDPSSTEAIRAAESALAAAVELEGISSDARFATRLLRRTLGRLRPGVDGDALVIGPDARWFERRNGDRVRLERHRNVRLVLLRLVAARLEAPGSPVPRAELIAAGWPGERILADAATNRLNVTLTRLKRLGFRDALLTWGEGILLDPKLPCERAAQ